MVARSGGYYGGTFCEERGVTQGNPLPPTIFNVVVDTVVCLWKSLLVAEREGSDSNSDKAGGTQTAGMTIWDQYEWI